MHKEVGETVKIGATLSVMSLVIMLIMFTVRMGKGIQEDSYGKADDLLQDVVVGQMEELIGRDDILSVASVYSIVSNNADVIPELDCKVCGENRNLVEEAPCLMNHMTGKVKMVVEHHDGGGYLVKLEEVE